jgi:hypothetical protein
LQLIQHRTIRGFLAAGLLGLFALAMTPKIVIHALVVRHHDVHLNHHPGTTDQLNTASFHCSTDNLVVTLPFVPAVVSMPVGAAPAFPVYRVRALVEPLSSLHPLYGLRGPPAAV